ncbi:UDP-N-acetylglucosamine 4,6-dehydratase (inverting) [Catenulispora sp. NF23]|uniref:UDP-N-acetylglucosamine 4,6-dehydratase (Inverting) n=1 Tax=Catenulispora pinistramenti TaxID=2705254 RepID=A0ABS5KP99_9ACTN|nr:UDP-N-acetylglucosamine 4,6-dehydratase (inverting) [Catenulispora pinistramenti]MBS2532708.1 UDP-N-acetylglucosamine 4,6-dehydratase (inverting) [Catenulispora pinistramenti]MBS2547875.1 UDP-N-acetylglucosamine 4,6-dehydratase (inverting) [Catenulispora pinistramenti]
MSELTDSTMLVTGGTGSFGHAFIRYALDELRPRTVVVFSRDEHKQYELRRRFGDEPRIRMVLGDIRNRESLARAMRGIDHVVHAAALKQADTAEFNVLEYVQTNIIGSQNVLAAAVECGVRKVVALSTDKASSPVSLYGATKMVADKMLTSAGARTSVEAGVRFSVVRYGNFVGSRGSVIPLFRELARAGQALPITDKRMTRFWVTLDQAVRFVAGAFDTMQGGELYVPKLPSMKITDLAEAVAPGCPTYEVGIRPGEKLHEEMIATEDSHRTFDLPDRYVVQPSISAGDPPPAHSSPVSPGFTYRSDTNQEWLSSAELRKILDSPEAAEPCRTMSA